MKKIQRLEMNGILNEPRDHFEMYEGPIYLYPLRHKGRIMGTNCLIRVPIDIVRHLDLKHKDRIIVAIKKVAEICEKEDTQ